MESIDPIDSTVHPHHAVCVSLPCLYCQNGVSMGILADPR